MVSEIKEVDQISNPSGNYKNIRFMRKSDRKYKEWFWSCEFEDFYNFISEYKLLNIKELRKVNTSLKIYRYDKKRSDTIIL